MSVETERPYSSDMQEDEPINALAEMMAHPVFRTAVMCVIAAFVLLAIVFAATRPPSLGTTYAAVTLNNGTTYFGKLSGLGSKYPVLEGAFLTKMEIDFLSGQEHPVLHSREEEFHAPGKMILNAEQILMVEPVGISSPVGQLLSKRPEKH